jgi:hypothetical protein
LDNYHTIGKRHGGDVEKVFQAEKVTFDQKNHLFSVFYKNSGSGPVYTSYHRISTIIRHTVKAYVLHLSENERRTIEIQMKVTKKRPMHPQRLKIFRKEFHKRHEVDF